MSLELFGLKIPIKTWRVARRSFPNEIKRQTLKYSHEALSIIDLAKGIAGYEADDEAIREAMIKLLNEAWDAESKCWKDPSLDLYAALKARENYSLWNLANVLREELQDEGHTIVSIEGIKTDIVGEIAQIKDDLKVQEASLIAQSPTMPLEEARQISSKLGATDEEKRSAQKTLLQEELPDVNLTPEFIYKSVVKDRRRWLNQHKLFWYYSNFEAVKALDTDHWLRNLRKFAEGKAIMSDIRSFSPKAKAIRNPVYSTLSACKTPRKFTKVIPRTLRNSSRKRLRQKTCYRPRSISLLLQNLSRSPWLTGLFPKSVYALTRSPAPRRTIATNWYSIWSMTQTD
jgi:hypothetical protein